MAATTAALWRTHATLAKATAIGTTSVAHTSSARKTRASPAPSTRTTTAAGRGSRTHEIERRDSYQYEKIGSSTIILLKKFGMLLLLQINEIYLVYTGKQYSLLGELCTTP